MPLKQLNPQELEIINISAQIAIGIGNDISKIPPDVFMENIRVTMHVQDLNSLVNSYLLIYDKILAASGTVQQNNNHTTIN